MTVAVTPAITTQPAPTQTVTAGTKVAFAVVATGTPTPTYQWKKGGAAIDGATSAAYAIDSAVVGNSGTYTVTVSNSAGSITSNDAVLVVNPAPIAPTITAQPAPTQTVTAGAKVTFAVVATGTPTPTYQWKKGGAAIDGATSAAYAIDSAVVGNSGTYTVTVSNFAGSITSDDAVLVVNPATTVAITSDPQPVTVTVPDGAQFSVTATGSNLTYTWLKNGASFGAPNASTLTVAATDLRNVADQYSVSVTDGVTPAVVSKAATLTVNAPKPVYAGDPTLSAPGHIYQVLASWNLAAPADPVLGSFRVGYDSTLLNPSWSATCFFPVLGTFSNKRPGTYPTDTRISGATPIDSSDYTGSGFSRGHQTGYADIAQRYGQPGGDSTMYMTNMCPQTQVLNGGVWEQLAGVLNGTSGQSFCNTFGRVWVYTGPIFADALVSPIGPRNIPVPSAFYNVVVRETSPGNPVALALITPHSTTIEGGSRNLVLGDCWKYVTTLDRVQSLTGLTFFPTPTSPLPADFTSTADVRGWGSVLENGIGKPNVHMIEPSWDSTFTLGLPLTKVKIVSGTVGTPIHFAAQATTSGTGAAATIDTTTWTFGDGGTANVPSTTYTYSTPGDYTVTFTAKDGAGNPNSISRVITVVGSGPSAPSISPIADVATNDTTPKTVTFTVSDAVPPAGSIGVTATSSNPAVLVDALVVHNTNGTCTLVLTPIKGGLGSSMVTVTATNLAGTPSSLTFNFTVTATPSSEGAPVLIISQYYENSATGRFVEVTNVGTGAYDATGSTKYYLGLLSNPFNSSGGSCSSLQALPSLSPGATVVYANVAAPTTPPLSAITGTPVVSGSVINFNGDDILYLTTNTTASLTGSWAARTDVLGASDVSWTGTSTTTANTAAAAGYRTSWVRNADIHTANPTFTLGEWTKVTPAAVGAALAGDTNRLGEHVYTH